MKNSDYEKEKERRERIDMHEDRMKVLLWESLRDRLSGKSDISSALRIAHYKDIVKRLDEIFDYIRNLE